MAASDTPTAVLRDEHQLILQVIDALESLLDHSARAGAHDFDALERCTSFFRLFADACHHGKEEDLLFPELEARGIPRDGGPIGVMLAEHAQGRAFVRTMCEALPQARAGEPTATDALIGAARGYIELLRGHINKEDNVLFMMADRIMDESSCARLCGEYAHVCSGQFEGYTKEQLQELAAGILCESA